LQPGDGDEDGDFDQDDIVLIQQAGKYLQGRSASWEDGDWNGGPGGAREILLPAMGDFVS
jgi:hypothetical protein